jgi:hypothetical protein
VHGGAIAVYKPAAQHIRLEMLEPEDAVHMKRCPHEAIDGIHCNCGNDAVQQEVGLLPVAGQAVNRKEQPASSQPFQHRPLRLLRIYRNCRANLAAQRFPGQAPSRMRKAQSAG